MPPLPSRQGPEKRWYRQYFYPCCNRVPQVRQKRSPACTRRPHEGQYNACEGVSSLGREGVVREACRERLAAMPGRCRVSVHHHIEPARIKTNPTLMTITHGRVYQERPKSEAADSMGAIGCTDCMGALKRSSGFSYCRRNTNEVPARSSPTG